MTGNIGYAGMYVDPETGLSRTPNREYDPSTGRWIQVDPSGFSAGDADLYRYVGNNVLNVIDPSGLAPALPTKPPAKFEPPTSPISSQKTDNGKSWNVGGSKATGDTYWMTNDGSGALRAYLYIAAKQKVYALGACKWNDGWNDQIAQVDGKGNVVKAVLFNLEGVDKTQKRNLYAALQGLSGKLNNLYANFEMNKKNKGEEAARQELGDALGALISGEEKLCTMVARTTFVKSGDPAHKLNDKIPDPGYYNALMYVWTAKDNQTKVYRLKDMGAGKPAEWVEYKKIDSNGDIVQPK